MSGITAHRQEAQAIRVRVQDTQQQVTAKQRDMTQYHKSGQHERATQVEAEIKHLQDHIANETERARREDEQADILQREYDAKEHEKQGHARSISQYKQQLDKLNQQLTTEQNRYNRLEAEQSQIV